MEYYAGIPVIMVQDVFLYAGDTDSALNSMDIQNDYMETRIYTNG